MTIHKEGTPTLLLSLIIFSVLNFIVYSFAPVLFIFTLLTTGILFLFLVSFFRKPDRSVNQINDNTLLSPCDGKVVVIEKVFEPEFLKSDCIQVSIFMSPLNVHINWYPSGGQVLYSKYHPGKFLAAWNPKASRENERTTVCYENNGRKVLLRQVAGALARRIVNYAKQGDTATQGQEMGFIKFGSRVDLYLPLNAEILVNLDDKVTGNRTVIASY
jgi:phosphatidylserine decarboxylase